MKTHPRMMRATGRMFADLKRRLGLAVEALVAMTLPAVADICATRQFEGTSYAVCTVDAADQDRLQLWLDGPDGSPLGDFTAVRGTLAPGEVLGFAMNAGMFHPDYAPVGLYRSDGVERGKVVTAGGGGGDQDAPVLRQVRHQGARHRGGQPLGGVGRQW